jgi:hypothetical protein
LGRTYNHGEEEECWESPTSGPRHTHLSKIEAGPSQQRKPQAFPTIAQHQVISRSRKWLRES